MEIKAKILETKCHTIIVEMLFVGIFLFVVGYLMNNS